MKMTCLTPRQEFIRDMWNDTPAAIFYWSSRTTITEDTITAVDEWGDEAQCTFDQFSTAINTFASESHKCGYWNHFAHDWRFDLDSADYDAGILDAIFQLAAFGEIVYG